MRNKLKIVPIILIALITIAGSVIVFNIISTNKISQLKPHKSDDSDDGDDNNDDDLTLLEEYYLFATAVRSYYMPIYLDAETAKEYYMGYAMFCRDIILHDTAQHDSFSTISDNYFEDEESMEVGYDLMNAEVPNWDRKGLIGMDLTDITTIVDWCRNEVDYEYDDGDYPRFAVETTYDKYADCEDQAVFAATCLESCDFDSVMVVFHDPNHLDYPNFYHGVCMVEILDPTEFHSLYPSCPLWSFDGGASWWCFIDTTWDVPFGSIPGWLYYYIDYGISFSIVSIAVCDVGGFVGVSSITEGLDTTFMVVSP